MKPLKEIEKSEIDLPTTFLYIKEDEENELILKQYYCWSSKEGVFSETYKIESQDSEEAIEEVLEAFQIEDKSDLTIHRFVEDNICIEIDLV